MKHVDPFIIAASRLSVANVLKQQVKDEEKTPFSIDSDALDTLCTTIYSFIFKIGRLTRTNTTEATSCYFNQSCTAGSVLLTLNQRISNSHISKTITDLSQHDTPPITYDILHRSEHTPSYLPRQEDNIVNQQQTRIPLPPVHTYCHTVALPPVGVGPIDRQQQEERLRRQRDVLGRIMKLTGSAVANSALVAAGSSTSTPSEIITRATLPRERTRVRPQAGPLPQPYSEVPRSGDPDPDLGSVPHVRGRGSPLNCSSVVSDRLRLFRSTIPYWTARGWLGYGTAMPSLRSQIETHMLKFRDKKKKDMNIHD